MAGSFRRSVAEEDRAPDTVTAVAADDKPIAFLPRDFRPVFVGAERVERFEARVRGPRFCLD